MLLFFQLSKNRLFAGCYGSGEHEADAFRAQGHDEHADKGVHAELPNHVCPFPISYRGASTCLRGLQRWQCSHPGGIGKYQYRW